MAVGERYLAEGQELQERAERETEDGEGAGDDRFLRVQFLFQRKAENQTDKNGSKEKRDRPWRGNPIRRFPSPGCRSSTWTTRIPREPTGEETRQCRLSGRSSLRRAVVVVSNHDLVLEILVLDPDDEDELPSLHAESLLDLTDLFSRRPHGDLLTVPLGHGVQLRAPGRLSSMLSAVEIVDPQVVVPVEDAEISLCLRDLDLVDGPSELDQALDETAALEAGHAARRVFSRSSEDLAFGIVARLEVELPSTAEVRLLSLRLRGSRKRCNEEHGHHDDGREGCV